MDPLIRLQIYRRPVHFTASFILRETRAVHTFQEIQIPSQVKMQTHTPLEIQILSHVQIQKQKSKVQISVFQTLSKWDNCMAEGGSHRCI